MGERRDDARRSSALSAAEGSSGPPLTLVAGFVLAVLATLAVFLTDNPQYLRVAVIAAAWAFVLAAVAVGRRRADRVATAAREAELRRAYQRELDRETAAHREYELELENDLRAEAAEVTGRELDGLRRDIAALASLRGEIGGIAALRSQLAELPYLRDELARLSSLQSDLAGLSSLRSDLAGLSALRAQVESLSSLRADVQSLTSLQRDLGEVGELRADLSRLRAELAELLSTELLIERIIMRTQGARGTAEPAEPAADRPADGLRWEETPPRELTGGWPAVQLDEVLGTREYERAWVDRPAAGRVDPAPPPTSAIPAFADSPWRASPPPDERADDLPPHVSRHAASAEPTAEPTTREWAAVEPADWQQPEPPLSPQTTEVDAIGVERPRPQPFPRHDRGYDEAGYRPVPAGYRPPPPQPESPPPAHVSTGQDTETGPVWVSEILAANGGGTSPTGRRRRRYRDEGAEDDVLNRVLRRGE